MHEKENQQNIFSHYKNIKIIIMSLRTKKKTIDN